MDGEVTNEMRIDEQRGRWHRVFEGEWQRERGRAVVRVLNVGDEPALVHVLLQEHTYLDFEEPSQSLN